MRASRPSVRLALDTAVSTVGAAAIAATVTTGVTPTETIEPAPGSALVVTPATAVLATLTATLTVPLAVALVFAPGTALGVGLATRTVLVPALGAVVPAMALGTTFTALVGMFLTVPTTTASEVVAKSGTSFPAETAMTASVAATVMEAPMLLDPSSEVVVTETSAAEEGASAGGFGSALCHSKCSI